jgi:hypothetical protein
MAKRPCLHVSAQITDTAFAGTGGNGVNVPLCMFSHEFQVL